MLKFVQQRLQGTKNQNFDDKDAEEVVIIKFTKNSNAVNHDEIVKQIYAVGDTSY